MILSENIIERLSEYIENNDIVYQPCDELIEVSNDKKTNNRKFLLESLAKTSKIEVYLSGSSFIHESFKDIDDWSNDNDCLFFLKPINLIMCIPKAVASTANFIIEK